MSKSSAVIGVVSVAVALSSVGYGVYASKRSEARIAALEARLAEAVKQSDGGSVTDLARVGTSSYAARADHVHPVCMEMGSTKTLTKASDGDSLTSAVSLDTSTWKPGANGVEETYCSRVIVQAAYRWFLFRTRKISKTGQVVYIGPEFVGFRARSK